MGDGEEWEEGKPEMIRGSKHSVDMRCEGTLTTVENAVREWDFQNIKSILPFNCCKHSTGSLMQHHDCTQNHVITENSHI